MNNIPGLVEDKVCQAKVKAAWARRQAVVADLRLDGALARLRRGGSKPKVRTKETTMRMDSPAVQVLCQAIDAFVSGQHGGHCQYVLQAYNGTWNLMDHGGPPSTTLEFTFQGYPVDEAHADGTPDLDPGAEEGGPLQETQEMQNLRNILADARTEARETKNSLEKSEVMLAKCMREFGEFQHEDAQLIRRLAAKTQAKFGVDQRAMFIKFLKWVLLNQGVDIVKTGVAREKFIDGKFEGVMTEEMVQMTGELVDEFMTSPEAPASAILPPSEGGKEDAKDL